MSLQTVYSYIDECIIDMQTTVNPIFAPPCSVRKYPFYELYNISWEFLYSGLFKQ